MLQCRSMSAHRHGEVRQPRRDPFGRDTREKHDTALAVRAGDGGAIAGMSPALYVINPATDFPSYFGGEVFAARGFPGATMVADLALPTLAALAPTDFDVTLCDESISAVDFEHPAPFVAITGKVTQFQRMVALAREFRRRGRIVLIGGPHASLASDELRPHCDILVRGEIEDISASLFADLRNGCWQTEYIGGRPDLASSPVPRWDLYPNDRALSATIQTSRGCPFGCEFCDVIQYLGRRQRVKPIAHVLSELDQVYRHGYRSVFLADDNLTARRSRAKELLQALRDWNDRQRDGEVTFGTQLSIDAAEDGELLRMCADAGVNLVFIGIETSNEESLLEANKPQNLRGDLVKQVQRFIAHGINVLGGMIVGFDADGLDAFERQFEFAQRSCVPIFTAGALVAPRSTPLHARMAEAGRLRPEVPESAALPWNSNIVPHRMTHEQLVAGMRWLCNRLYDPQAFGRRLHGMVELFGSEYLGRQDARRQAGRRRIDREAFQLVAGVGDLGPAEATLVDEIFDRVRGKPQAVAATGMALLHYQQIRFMLEYGSFWDAGTPLDRPSLVVG